MSFVFEIAGQICTADQVRMCGNLLEVDFQDTAMDALENAFKLAHPVSVIAFPSMPVTYSVQRYNSDGQGGCKATFSVNSSLGRVLH